MAWSTIPGSGNLDLNGAAITAGNATFTGSVAVGGSLSAQAPLHVVGGSSTASPALYVSDTTPTYYFQVYNANTGADAPNAANATTKIRGMSSTSRSINAGGTVNASGSDYAEYMTKARDFTLAKGDICGVDANGLLTDRFDEAVAFVIKSTAPSYVGGDTWGSKDAIGLDEPMPPILDARLRPINESVASDEEIAAWEAAKSAHAKAMDEYEPRRWAFDVALEKARARVDRIAFSGQVPVNVTGAKPGDYIVPAPTKDGGISGRAVSAPSFDEYRNSVGRVIAPMPDGRARIIVKVS